MATYPTVSPSGGGSLRYSPNGNTLSLDKINKLRIGNKTVQQVNIGSKTVSRIYLGNKMLLGQTTSTHTHEVQVYSTKTLLTLSLITAVDKIYSYDLEMNTNVVPTNVFVVRYLIDGVVNKNFTVTDSKQLISSSSFDSNGCWIPVFKNSTVPNKGNTSPVELGTISLNTTPKVSLKLSKIVDTSITGNLVLVINGISNASSSIGFLYTSVWIYYMESDGVKSKAVSVAYATNNYVLTVVNNITPLTGYFLVVGNGYSGWSTIGSSGSSLIKSQPLSGSLTVRNNLIMDVDDRPSWMDQYGNGNWSSVNIFARSFYITGGEMHDEKITKYSCIVTST